MTPTRPPERTPHERFDAGPRSATNPTARPQDMKLIIQIPCFNEQEQLPLTLSHLPRKIEGFDAVEWLIIDDGSTDETISTARAHGVDHVVRLTNHKGLAAAFQAGLDAGLKLGADVIVNTDADNQYEGADIPKLVAPILRGEADMVIGDRQVDVNENFSRAKRRLQRLGSWVVRQASSTEIPDTTSGFRAYNREAALQMQAVSKFTYTLETIIQAGKLLVAIDHVPIQTNAKTRESRLFPSMTAYIRRNALSIFRIYAQYEPLRVFWGGAVILGVPALALFIRFIITFIQHGGRRPRAVTDLRRGSVHRGHAARRTGRHRRPAQPSAHAVPAHPRARPANRVAARRRALALRARRDGPRTGRGTPAGRRRDDTENREALEV